MSEVQSKIIQGDSRDVLKTMGAASIDLIVTSPPYADQRKSTYAGIINRFTQEFASGFCEQDGRIAWERLVELTSRMEAAKRGTAAS